MWIEELIELAAPARFTAEERRVRAEIVIAVQFTAVQLLSAQARGEVAPDVFRRELAEVLASGLAPPRPGDAEPTSTTRAARAAKSTKKKR